MKNVLIIVETHTHFVELSRLARILSTSGKYNPKFWFHFPYATIEKDVNMCRLEGWEYAILPGSINTSSTNSKRETYKRFLKSVLPKIVLRCMRFVWELFLNKRIISELAFQTRSINDKYQIAIIVLAEDNIGYLTHVIIRSGKDFGIPTVIMPYTIANASEAAEYFCNLREYDANATFIHRMVAKIFPHWVYGYKGRKILRLSPGAITAIETSRFPCDHPWRLQNEDSAVIAVENKQMLKYYRNEGLDDNRLVLTGAIYDDILASFKKDAGNYKKKLYNELHFAEDKPLLLCALPPVGFLRDCEFNDYESLVTFWMQTLETVQGWNVLVRPHPRQTQNYIEALEKFRVNVTTLDTASLVPLCDLYVTSLSATIRWAIACGKPVINYDAFQMKYTDYSEVKGVITVYKREDFISLLNRFTTDKTYLTKVRRVQEADSQSWGMLDGKSSERILRLFDDIIAGKYMGEHK
jgi:hypothetical protein